MSACARGEIPANIAAMQLLIESRRPGEAEMALSRLVPRLRDQTQAMRLRAALDLLRANPNAWSTVKAVLSDVSHDSAATTADEQIRRFASAFDRAAHVAPEGSVALYALGNPDILKAATGEVVERMREWDLLGPGRRVLDLGCGIGRFGEALAAETQTVVGIDISGEMIAAARRRCSAAPNLTFLQSSGRDLSQFENGCFDLVLAVDTFPYLVQAGMSLAERHVAEAARVLRARGDLLVLNFSYRGDANQDRADMKRLSQAFGFEVVRDGIPAFTLWDGLAFRLVKAS
jgi:ubiquinone/menaquinone biosynthesis C-methylase UbiE